MQKQRFGASGREVSVIGQGTWYIEQADRAVAIAALRRGLDLGLHHIDTAEMYGSGAAETIVGEAIHGRRDEVFLVSKVLPTNASRAGTRRACEASLKRLKTDRLDCYLLHWRGQHPLAETIAAFEELKREGKILSWGVSNFDEEDLAEALTIAGKGQIACNQVLYHLGERAIEHAVIPLCAQQAVAVVAYSPFGHTGFPARNSKGGYVLADIAKARGASLHQVALAFLTRTANVFAIPKAARLAHVEEQCQGKRYQAQRRRCRAPRGSLSARREATRSADDLILFVSLNHIIGSGNEDMGVVAEAAHRVLRLAHQLAGFGLGAVRPEKIDESRLAGGPVLAGRLAQSGSGRLDIQNVVGDLEGKADPVGIERQCFAFGRSRLAEDRTGTACEAKERTGLHRLQGDDAADIGHARALGLEIEHLAAGHAARSGRRG